MAPTNPADVVDKATSEYLIQMDWTTCLQICDSLNSYPSNARPVVRAILRRFKEKSRVVMLALELSESLVQNCVCTHEAFGESTFQTELAKLIMNKKTKDNVKEKALELVETWGHAFQYRHDIPGFYESYSFLKRSGYRFPPRRPDAPVLDFNRGRGAPPAPSRHSAPPMPAPAYYGGGGGLSAGGLHPRSGSNPPPVQPAPSMDVASIRGSLSIFQEMVSFLNVEEEAPSQNSLLQELRTTLKENQTRIADKIQNGSVSSNELESMLLLNDELVKALGDYDAACLRRKQFEDNGFRPLPMPEKKTVNGHGLNDIDFSTPSFGQQANTFAPQQHQQQQYHQQQQIQQQMQFQQQQQPILLSKPPPPQAYNPFLSPQPQQSQQLAIQHQPPPQQQPQQQNNTFDEFDLFIVNRNQQQQQPSQTQPPQPQQQQQQQPQMLQLMPPPTFQPTTSSNPFVQQQQSTPFPPPATSKSTPLQPPSSKPAAAPMPPPFNNPFSSPYYNNPVTQPMNPTNPFNQPFQPQQQQQMMHPNNMAMQPYQPQPQQPQQQQPYGVQFPSFQQQSQQQPMQYQNNPFGGAAMPMVNKPMMPSNNNMSSNPGPSSMVSNKTNPNQASLI